MIFPYVLSQVFPSEFYRYVIVVEPPKNKYGLFITPLIIVSITLGKQDKIFSNEFIVSIINSIGNLIKQYTKSSQQHFI